MIIEVGLYLLICNTIRRWLQNLTTEVRRIEVDGMGRHQYQEPHSFKTILDGSYDVQDHLIPNARRRFGRRW